MEMEEDGSTSPTERTAIKSRSFHQQDDLDLPQHARQPCWSITRRYFVAFMAFLGFANVYALRANLSVAIVAMTKNQSTTVDGVVVYHQEYDWDSGVQGVVLSSFFYGYIVTQIPGGWLANRVGGKKLFGVGVAVTAVITLLTPLLAATSLYMLVLGRVVEGFFEGVTYPSIHAVWSRWAPPLERSTLATIAFSGSYFGTVVAMPLSGFLAEKVGWQYIFYLFGVLALAWCAAWFRLVSETPQSDSRITEHELDFIRSSIGPSANHIQVNVDIPWKRFLTSLPVWAIIIAHFTENWGFYTLLTELPTFMNDVFGYDLQHAGMLSALPYLMMGIFVQVGGRLADWLLAVKYLTTTHVRKLLNCIAFLAQAVFLVIATNGGSAVNVVASLTLAVGFGGFAWAGFSVNHLDIAPQFASILMGLSNTVATLPGILSPLLTGHLVQHKSPAEWQVVFYIAAGVYLTGAVFYWLFASGERQKWADIADAYALTRDDQSHASTEDLPFGAGSCR